MKRQVHTMKAGTITAKLRDAVPVCFYENGSEVTRYRNIDIPDSLKELEIKDFAFNIAQDGKITLTLRRIRRRKRNPTFPKIRRICSRTSCGPTRSRRNTRLYYKTR